nr:SpaA isopeptide-forming pilin-related protein [Bifidobacterium felsineum]
MPASEDNRTKVENERLPVYIKVNVAKSLEGLSASHGAKEATFDLSDEDGNVLDSKTITLTKPGKDPVYGSAWFVLAFADKNAKIDKDEKGYVLPERLVGRMTDANGNPVDEKTFAYTITERKGDDPEILYNPDGETYKVEVTVRRLTASALGAEVRVLNKNGSGVSPDSDTIVTPLNSNGSVIGSDGNTSYISFPQPFYGIGFRNVVKPILSFRKVDAGDTDQGLQGAGFRLYKCSATGMNGCSSLVDWRNGSTPEWTPVDDMNSLSDGMVRSVSLDDGTYRLVETNAPAGHLLPSGQWDITVKDGVMSDPTGVSYMGMPPAFVRDAAGDLILPNTPVVAAGTGGLPMTGGWGLVPWLLAGGLPVMLGILLYSEGFRRKALHRK